MAEADYGCRRDVRPPMNTFSPNMWGHTFSTFTLDHQVQERYAEAIEGLKEEVKVMLMAETSEKLIILIDRLERLGLAYHLETEIEEKLKEIHGNVGDQDDYDLFIVALRFRLLRQHQYQVSCRVFENFASEDKKYKETLSNDVEGLLSLYEAAHVQIPDEEILEEGLAFAVDHLTRMLPQLDSSRQDKVKQALDLPLHKGVTIVQIRRYISTYERVDTRDQVLLKFAKLNYNFLQNLYKSELCQLLRWWNEFELELKLPFVRDRVTEFYFWGMTYRFEPQYCDVRLLVAKVMQLQTIMDDTYDNYVTLKEAQLFTEALERWNIDEIDRLSGYLKISYQYILQIYEDIERDAVERGTAFALPHLKETTKQFGRAYNEEQEWVMEKHIPLFEKYLANSLVTSGVYVLLAAIFLGMKSISKDNIDWLISRPNIVISTAKLVRLLNDLVSHDRESRGGEMITQIDLRTKNDGLSREEVLSKLAKQINDEWKDLNKEWVLATTCGVPKIVVEQLLNYTRGAQVIYNKDDGITYPQNHLAPLIVLLLVDPFAI